MLIFIMEHCMLTIGRKIYIQNKINENNKKISNKIEEINKLQLQSSIKGINNYRINAISNARKYIVFLQKENKKLINEFNKNQ